MGPDFFPDFALGGARTPRREPVEGAGRDDLRLEFCLRNDGMRLKTLVGNEKCPQR